MEKKTLVRTLVRFVRGLCVWLCAQACALGLCVGLVRKDACALCTCVFCFVRSFVR